MNEEFYDNYDYDTFYSVSAAQAEAEEIRRERISHPRERRDWVLIVSPY